MRKIHNILLDNIDNGERVKAVDIISKALSKEFGKSCAVFQEGHFSECAIEAIPASVSVFVIGRPQLTKEQWKEADDQIELVVNPSAPQSAARSAATGAQVPQQMEAS
jgi:Fe-S cluster assembly ATPase SufC